MDFIYQENEAEDKGEDKEEGEEEEEEEEEVWKVTITIYSHFHNR